MFANETKWSKTAGFGNLSAGAQEIAIYADENEGNISGILQKNPGLVASLDEFHKWSAITVPTISGNNTITDSGHSMKKILNK